jgi:hypothetical protein
MTHRVKNSGAGRRVSLWRFLFCLGVLLAGLYAVKELAPEWWYLRGVKDVVAALGLAVGAGCTCVAAALWVVDLRHRQ